MSVLLDTQKRPKTPIVKRIIAVGSIVWKKLLVSVVPASILKPVLMALETDAIAKSSKDKHEPTNKYFLILRVSIDICVLGLFTN